MDPKKHPNPLIACIQLLAILMLLIAIFPMPPDYYSFLRCCVVIACLATIYDSRYWSVPPSLKRIALGGFVLLAMIFNPVVLCTFYRTTWGFIDLVAVAALVWAFFGSRHGANQGDVDG